MNRTRESLRRGVVYGVLLLACIAYGSAPLTERERAMERARAATEQAADWLGARFNRGPK